MSRAVDVLAVLLLVMASASFGFGLQALDLQEDFRALYLLAVGALALRASVEILRPRSGAG